MATWKRKPQEVSGDYRFDGHAYTTPGVLAELAPDDIACILADLLRFAASGSADYLQVVRHVNGEEKHCSTQSELPAYSVRACLSLAGNGLETPKGGGQHSMAGKDLGRRKYLAEPGQRKVDTAKGLHCMNPSGSSHQVSDNVGYLKRYPESCTGEILAPAQLADSVHLRSARKAAKRGAYLYRLFASLETWDCLRWRGRKPPPIGQRSSRSTRCRSVMDVLRNAAPGPSAARTDHNLSPSGLSGGYKRAAMPAKARREKGEGEQSGSPTTHRT